MMEVETNCTAYKAEEMNNQNKALGIDTRSVKQCYDPKLLIQYAKALSKQLQNTSKSLEFHRNRESVTEKDLDTIHRMDTNFRHQNALLHQIETQLYITNPITFSAYLRDKKEGFSYVDKFYSIAKKKLPTFIFNWIENAAKEEFSITN